MTQAVMQARRQPKASPQDAVLNAGWQAMQKADANLTRAVQNMPPEIARGVVLQYTNAIRSNQDADASNIAMQYARDALAGYQPANVRRGQSQPLVSNVDMFEKALQNQLPRPKQVFTGIGFARNNFMGNNQPQRSGMNIVSLAGLINRNKAPAAPKTPEEAFGNVRSEYNKFNQAGMTEYDKNLIWNKPPDKELTAFDSWSPSGLIGSNLNTRTNPFNITGIRR
jgi:hypothetical protein